MKLKLISLLLCVSMLAACLAGCGSEPAKVVVTENPAPTESPAPAESPDPTESPTDAPTETLDPEEAARRARYQAAYEKYDPDQAVILINDEPITWSKYYSWVYDIANQLETSFGIIDWNEPRADLISSVPDATFGSYLRKHALGYIVQIAVIGQKAEELGIGLSEAQQAEIDSMIDGYTVQVGGEEELKQLLSDNYITMDYFLEQYEAMTLLDNIYVELYGEYGEKLPEEDAISYLKDQGYLYAKHILFRTVDDDRQPLSEEEIAQKRAEAEEVLARLQNCPPEDLEEFFDSLMQQYSEDTGMLSYPDGYYFVDGQMVISFEEAVKSLEENGLSALVESEYGYHIIYRPSMRADHIMGYDNNYTAYTPRDFASAALFDAVSRDWYASAESSAVYVAGFESLDFNELFNP